VVSQDEVQTSFVLIVTLAMANHDRELALAIHVDMLTRTSGEDITLWMSGVKQLIMRL
jgi:protein transport protein SEC31